MEFLVHMVVGRIDDGGGEEHLRDQEAVRAAELARSGNLLRLWRVPGQRANWGIWRADDLDQLHHALASLPLFPFLTITVHPLAPHPNDPFGSDSPAFTS